MGLAGVPGILGIKSGSRQPPPYESYDYGLFKGIVDGEGYDDNAYATIQAADDDLDSGPYTLLVKSGSYAGWTTSTDNARIRLEPGTTITSAIVLSGDNVTLECGPGCDIQAAITLSGTHGSLLCKNGVDTDGIAVTGTECFVDGGGWGTIHDGGTTSAGIKIGTSSDDALVLNMASDNTLAQSGLSAVLDQSDRTVFSGVKVIDSDDDGILQDVTASNDGLVIGCILLGADVNGIELADRGRAIGNYIINAGADGIAAPTTGPNSLMVGNVVQDPTTSSVDADGANQVVVGNRVDGAVADGSGGTNVVASNDETAF